MKSRENENRSVRTHACEAVDFVVTTASREGSLHLGARVRVQVRL